MQYEGFGCYYMSKSILYFILIYSGMMDGVCGVQQWSWYHCWGKKQSSNQKCLPKANYKLTLMKLKDELQTLYIKKKQLYSLKSPIHRCTDVLGNINSCFYLRWKDPNIQTASCENISFHIKSLSQALAPASLDNGWMGIIFVQLFFSGGHNAGGKNKFS